MFCNVSNIHIQAFLWDILKLEAEQDYRVQNAIVAWLCICWAKCSFNCQLPHNIKFKSPVYHLVCFCVVFPTPKLFLCNMSITFCSFQKMRVYNLVQIIEIRLQENFVWSLSACNSLFYSPFIFRSIAWEEFCHLIGLYSVCSASGICVKFALNQINRRNERLL